MQKAIKVKALIKGGKIEVPASIGATVVRVVGPPTYRGVTVVTPSDETQVLPTKDKLVRDDITVHPAPTETLSTTSNGTFTPSEGHVGFSEVDVNVNPDLRPLSVNENGSYQPDGFDGYSDVTVDVEPNLETLSVTENGLYLPESGTDGFDRVNVDVPQKITFESFTLGNYPFGDVKIDPSITDLRTRIQTQLGITSIDFQNVKKTNEATDLFYGCTNLRTIYAPKMELVGNSLFKNCYALYEDDTINLAEIMPVATTFNSWVFTHCRFTKMILPPTVKRIYLRAFGEIPSLHTVYFTGVAESVVLDSSIFDATVTEIYVPWSEGAVRNAPWGATGATIHYDTVYDSEWNVISST